MRLLRWAVLLCRLVRAPSLGTGPELLPREWHTLAPSPPSASGAYPLRVAQFNILADGLAGKHPQLGGFTDTPAGALEWEVRRARVCVAMRAGGGAAESESESERAGDDNFNIRSESACFETVVP